MHTANTNTPAISSATVILFPSVNDRPARANDGAPATVLAFPAAKDRVARERRVAGAYEWLLDGTSADFQDWLDTVKGTAQGRAFLSAAADMRDAG